MKTKNFAILTLLTFVLGFWACDFFDPAHLDDPNRPSVEEVAVNANKAQLQNLVTGLEVRHRSGVVNLARVIASFGREIYPMNASDPRDMRELLGLQDGANAETDPSFRGLASVWNTPYAAIKQANVLIASVENTDALSDAEKNGYIGYAKTIKAFQYLIPLITQSKDNGIRIDVEDALNPGPFVPFDQAIVQIRSLLTEAYNNLNQAGGSFAFTLTDGYSGFNNPGTFKLLNRAVDARAALYAGDWPGALSSLEDAKPFFELTTGQTAMNKGASFVYSGPPDSFNPFYYPENAETSQIHMVHPSMPDDIEAGDQRAEKFFLRNNPITMQGLTSWHQDGRFDSNTDNFPWVRNEELILIYAESKAQSNDLVEAVKAINYVRNTWGLPDFNSNVKADVVDQVLLERRYSLWYEQGVRWVDAKRYNRFDQIPDDGGKIFEFYARPLSENNWDDFNAN